MAQNCRGKKSIYFLPTNLTIQRHFTFAFCNLFFPIPKYSNENENCNDSNSKVLNEKKKQILMMSLFSGSGFHCTFYGSVRIILFAYIFCRVWVEFVWFMNFLTAKLQFFFSFVGSFFFFAWYYRVFALFRIWIHLHVIWMRRNMFSLFIFALKGVAFAYCSFSLLTLSSDERINKKKTPQSFFRLSNFRYGIIICVQSFFFVHFCYFVSFSFFSLKCSFGLRLFRFSERMCCRWRVF